MSTKLPAVVLLAFVACGGAVTTPIAGSDAGTSPSGSVAAPTPLPQPPPIPDASVSGTVACGDTTCAASGGESPFCCITRLPLQTTFACRTSDANCRGHQVACDDTSDCTGGEVCCAEVSYETDLPILWSMCRPSCVTGVPRVQVCNAARQCASGSCQPYDCRGYPDLKYCELPDFCR